jgi:Raf kinase inhibitor-like YbhB/YbcL family protein
MSIKLISPAFADGEPIPRKYAQEGQDVSPPLSWTGVPQQAAELALIVDDPDAPQSEPFVHWVIYKIPVVAPGLTEHVPPNLLKVRSPAGALQGKNSANKIGYDGPAPPPGHGTHHYQFRLYALDQPLDLSGGLDNKLLVAAMSGHVLDQGQLIGTYER